MTLWYIRIKSLVLAWYFREITFHATYKSKIETKSVARAPVVTDAGKVFVNTSMLGRGRTQACILTETDGNARG